MELRKAIAETVAAGAALRKALEADDLAACETLVARRDQQLRALEASLQAASATDREACSAAWEDLLAADAELRAALASRRDAVGTELAALRVGATSQNPYRPPTSGCCDRQA